MQYDKTTKQTTNTTAHARLDIIKQIASKDFTAEQCEQLKELLTAILKKQEERKKGAAVNDRV